MHLMRTMLVALLLALALAAGGRAVAARASATAPRHRAESPAVAPQGRPAVDEHTESRVPVMLVVLGIAAFVVVGLGTAGYIVRRILGRVSPPPDQETAGHH